MEKCTEEEVNDDLSHERWIGIWHPLKEIKMYSSEEIENTKLHQKSGKLSRGRNHSPGKIDVKILIWSLYLPFPAG